MRAVLLSDAHLAGPDDPAQQELVAFVDALRADELVLVGDIAEFWWSSARAVFVDYVPLLAALHRFEGRVTWVAGNHELRCGGALRELGIHWSTAWRGESQSGERIVAVHGDRADGSRGHRAWSRVLRSRWLPLLVGWVGPDRTQRWARRWSERSRHGMAPPTQLLARQGELADRLLSEGADVVCLGHTHAPGVQERERGALVNLGDWCEHRTFAVVEDAVTLRRWTPGGAVSVDGEPRRRGWVRASALL